MLAVEVEVDLSSYQKKSEDGRCDFAMTYEAEPEALDPEALPALLPAAEVAALVVVPLAAAVVEAPVVAAAVVEPAAVVEAPEAALVSPVKQLLLAGDTFQRKTRGVGDWKRTTTLDGNRSRLSDRASGIRELKANGSARGDVSAPREGGASEARVLLKGGGSGNSTGVDTTRKNVRRCNSLRGAEYGTHTPK